PPTPRDRRSRSFDGPGYHRWNARGARRQQRGSGGAMATERRGEFGLEIPVHEHRLANGLRVVLSPERSAPIVTVAVYYYVGMRLEPQGRTGFAHLFEQLMFQGSAQMEKMELVRLVQKNGGTLNGSTRYDFTNYCEVLPAHALELALWMEAD